jgi:3-oxoacyl-[acyl-carrier protein] reductase
VVHELMSASVKVALVTGAGRGIGRAIALKLAADGYDIAGTWNRDQPSARSMVEGAEALSRRAVSYHVDVSNPDDVSALSEALAADFGRLDALVSNGGVASRGLTVVETELAEVQRVLGVHAIGVFQLCSLLVPMLRRSPHGGVVMISSVITTNPFPGGGPYQMAKMALEALAATLALEEAEHGTRVNVVAPGLTVSEMGDRLARAITGAPDAAALDATTPFGRVTRPADVADVVSFLLSPAAQQVTGQRIEVHGGRPNMGG